MYYFSLIERSQRVLAKLLQSINATPTLHYLQKQQTHIRRRQFCTSCVQLKHSSEQKATSYHGTEEHSHSHECDCISFILPYQNQNRTKNPIPTTKTLHVLVRMKDVRGGNNNNTSMEHRPPRAFISFQVFSWVLSFGVCTPLSRRLFVRGLKLHLLW